MNSRERFFKACEGASLPRPPIWVMRQAGRYLPEYRALKEKHSFLEMVRTPELACEVTLQPLKRFALDAAIIFSDILVIPEALGQAYHFRDTGGIEMDFHLRHREQVDKMEPRRVGEKLKYVTDALRLVRKELDGKKALLGFGGSPWTLATYMIEGGSSKNHETIKCIYYEDTQLFESIMQKLCDALILYFKMQIEAGVDAIQIFDSFGHLCAENEYYELSLKWVAKIAEALGGVVPIIFYAKGMGHLPQLLKLSGANIYSVDWTVSLPHIKRELGQGYGVQGNLDPALLSTSPECVRKKTLALLDRMKLESGYIFNLGHGILPTAKLACMEALVDTVSGYDRDIRGR